MTSRPFSASLPARSSPPGPMPTTTTSARSLIVASSWAYVSLARKGIPYVIEMDAAKPKLSTMLARGVRKRCARCGAGHLFSSWFRMRDRCPGCGYRFDRGTGFFLGAYTLNLLISEMALGVILAILIFKAATGHIGAWWPYIVVAAITQLAVPLI